MTKEIKLILTTKELAALIKSGKYKNKKKINLLNYFKQLSNGDYIPDDSKRVQVREKDRDLDFIDRIVNKVKSTNDYSNLDTLVIVYFSETDEYRILNGNHTSEIMVRLNIFDVECYVVDFETQLQGKNSELKKLGCLLNKVEKETQPVAVGDVKGILYDHMKEREEDGLDPTPTQEYCEELLKTFPSVSRRTFSLWIQNHDVVGSRRDPVKSWTAPELQDQKMHYENSLKYQDYVVTDPRSIEAWDQTAISTSFVQCQRKDKRKVLLIFFCDNAKQVLTLTTTDRKSKWNNCTKIWVSFSTLKSK